MNLNDRFDSLVRVVNASCTQQSNATTTGEEVYGSSVTLEAGEAGKFLGLKWLLSGTKTGTNAAHTVTLMSTLSATPLMTLTADDATAVDWVAEFQLISYGGSKQKVLGRFLADTADPDVDYAAATQDLKNGAKLYVNITSGHTSDTVTAEMCVTTRWLYVKEDL